jgi:hypothetical protein
VSFRCKGKSSYPVFTSSTWGVTSRNPNECYRKIHALQVLTAAAGFKVRSSVAATAVQAYLDRFDGKDGRPALAQLPCRWRGIAHASLHGGPIAVLKGRSPFAVQIDVRKAYLDALYQDVPVLGRQDGSRVGGYYTHDDRRWSKIRTYVGFVDATLRVKDEPDNATYLPPLPVHFGFGSAFPAGTIRGCWTIAQVRDAEERGEAEILKVHQFAFAPQTQPLFAEIADTFLSLPDSLGKRLYTRFWGKFGTRGGYKARRSVEPVYGEVPSAGLWWSYDGIPLDSHRARPTYRPDLASFVCAYNHRRVMDAMRQLKPGSVHAVHVDSIWTSDVVGAAKLSSTPDEVGAWRTKRTGPLRFYGIGCYEHRGHCAASGYDAAVHGKLNRQRMEAFIQSPSAAHRKLLLHTRNWTADPAFDPTATSTPLFIDMDMTASPVEGPSVYSDAWTMGGWSRPTPEDAYDPDAQGPPTWVDDPPASSQAPTTPDASSLDVSAPT